MSQSVEDRSTLAYAAKESSENGNRDPYLEKNWEKIKQKLGRLRKKNILSNINLFGLLEVFLNCN